MTIDSLWDFDDPAGSEARFRAALAEHAPGTPGAIELATQIARAQGLQRSFDAAHATLDALAPLAEGRGGRLEARYLLERGRAHRSGGDPAAARPLFERAWDVARAVGEDGLAVDAAHMAALVAPGQEQHAWNLRALELAESSADPGARRWRASLLNNIGWAYHDRGDHAQALESFERALAARLEQSAPGPVRIARWSVARAQRSLGRLEEALAGQRALLAELEAAGESDGYVDEEIGECLLALGRADDARPHFRRAHALLAADAWLAENEAARLARLRELGGE